MLSPMKAPPESAAWIAEYQAMTTEEIKVAFHECFDRSKTDLLRMACMVHVMLDRGEDPSELAGDMLPSLRKIGCRQLLPETVVVFGKRPKLFRKIESLPTDEQERLADGGRVKVVVYTPSGERTERMAKPLDLEGPQIEQVFGRNYIRNEAQQALWLDNKREKSRGTPPTSIDGLKIDTEMGGVWVKRQFFPLATLLAAVKALKK